MTDSVSKQSDDSKKELKPFLKQGKVAARLLESTIKRDQDNKDIDCGALYPALASLAQEESKGGVCTTFSAMREMAEAIRDADKDKRLINVEDLRELPNVHTFRSNSVPRGALFVIDDAPEDGDARFYKARNFANERKLARRVLAFADRPPSIPMPDLTNDEDGTVRRAFERDLLIVTGGPGTGKTFRVLKILDALLQAGPGLRVMLAAPTGKAAARLMQSVAEGLADDEFAGMPAGRRAGILAAAAGTLHSFLCAADDEGRRPSPGNPLPYDVVIIDECSMIALDTAARALGCIDPEVTKKLILLGDKDQLCAVDSGSVLADLCKALPACVKALEKSRRFEDGKNIKRLADAIN
ncbi:MAG: AAA family ATPase, partial [Duodenibacillus sp.]|nr:AAA family ATPase [Duodenibacillus sp.]